jgi:alkanesulfonate monooxygenase
MSRGRIELGLGSGWFEAEHTAYGVPFPALGERFDRLTEQLEIITGLWGTLPGERFSHAGAHYTLTDSPALPKPVQQPHPPIIVGGKGPKRTPALAARFANEVNVPFAGIDEVAAQFARVDEACRTLGRDPGELVRSTAQTIAIGRDDAEVARRAVTLGREVADVRANGLAGTVAEVVDRIGQWREKTGVTRLYLQLMDMADLDQIELVAAEVAPQLR